MVRRSFETVQGDGRAGIRRWLDQYPSRPGKWRIAITVLANPIHMERCPWCRERVEQLHPVPPEVVTRGLVDAAGGAEMADSLVGCTSCIESLMDGKDIP